MQQVINKKDVPEILELKVEKLSNLGLGIARYNGYVIFVEGACPGDFLKVRIGKKNKNFANAKILEIIQPSEHRVENFCPMQKVCGSCQLQFIDYNFQLILKKQIVEDAMHSILGDDISVNDVIPSPVEKEYRCKIQYPVSQTKDSKKILAGYYKLGTHEIVNIKYCPIQPSYCDQIIEYIRNEAKNLGISGYDEKKHSGDLRHVVIRTSKYNLSSLVVLVINSPKLLDKIKTLAENIYEHFEDVLGVSVNYNSKQTNLIMTSNNENIIGSECIEEKLCDKVFKVGAQTFFQVNPLTADKIFKYVKTYVSSNFESPMLLDAYAGISTFGICLSDVVQKAVCVEEVKASVDLASKVLKDNNIKNVELHNMVAAMFFEKELKTKGRKFDITVLDPPRKGCSEESLEYVLKLTKSKIVYVSCNPATLARDLRYLVDRGCKIESIQPFDMFPHTYHIENVAIISL